MGSVPANVVVIELMMYSNAILRITTSHGSHYSFDFVVKLQTSTTVLYRTTQTPTITLYELEIALSLYKVSCALYTLRTI